MQFVVKGYIPVKGRPRFSRDHAYTPQRTRDAEQKIGLLAKLAMKGRPPIDGPCSVLIKSEIGSLKKKRLGQPAISRGDVDNFAKLFLDAINGIVYLDDRQVTDLHIVRQYGHETQTLVIVEKLNVSQ